jgi:hypothetical protein
MDRDGSRPFTELTQKNARPQKLALLRAVPKPRDWITDYPNGERKTQSSENRILKTGIPDVMQRQL